MTVRALLQMLGYSEQNMDGKNGKYISNNNFSFMLESVETEIEKMHESLLILTILQGSDIVKHNI